MAQPWWKPVWSVPAAMRAVRATIVVPALFALSDKVIGNPQVALFATFGGFATLVIANFGGSRKDKFIAHTGLAITGSVALIIGTLVSSTTWLAALVTIPVTFAIFFAGVAGPNAVSGSTAAMFAYVLPVASAGGVGTIPARLEGWWLASVVGTLAVLLLSPPTPGDKLRAAATELAGELASRLRAAAAGEASQSQAVHAARNKLMTAFTAAPYRPTGLATADQALGGLVQLLEWGSVQIADAFDGHVDMTMTSAADRDLLRASAAMFGDVQALMSGRAAEPDFDGLEAARIRSAETLRDLAGDAGVDARAAAAHAVHAQSIATVARGAGADALIASRRATPDTIAAVRRQWYGQSPARLAPAVAQVATSVPASTTATAGPPPGGAPPHPNGAQGTAQAASAGTSGTATSPASILLNGAGRLSSLGSVPPVAGLAGATRVVARHATIRSVWFLNSLRGAFALAAAVAVADLSGVQHAFWVVLGTLSVLRTSASATGATAVRALAGTVIGFAIGALLLLGIGTTQTALWIALPVAVLVAAYAPGTTPFLVGQAAFTVTIVVLFNLLAPAGWKVGLLRVEDVAIGCGVSLVVGVLFWPRGASSVVGDDLADAFRRGAEYLTQAVGWALSELTLPPAAAAPAISAALRLDDAVRGLLAEQGSKRVSKEDLWTLVMATTRLRLTAQSLAGLRQADTAPGAPPGAACLPLAGAEEYAGAPACVALHSEATGLAGFYRQVADEVGRTGRSGQLATVPAPPVMGPAVPRTGVVAGDGTVHPHLLWVQEHLHHLSQAAQMVIEPARHVAEARRRPWWR
jgi:Fusaric acid resistance protein-like